MSTVRVVYAAAMEDVRRKTWPAAIGRGEAHERQVQGVPRDPNIHAGQMGAALFVGRARRGMWLRIALGLLRLPCSRSFFIKPCQS
jgi:hypothetical protein